jgi:hypothetical protein
MAKKPLSVTYKPYLLPSEFSEMDKFIENNKTIMTEQVISSIEYALEKKLQVVEVFKFKKSNFVITMSYETFQQNLENVYNYYIEMEKYELCGRVKKLEDKLKTVFYNLNSHEKK